MLLWTNAEKTRLYINTEVYQILKHYEGRGKRTTTYIFALQILDVGFCAKYPRDATVSQLHNFVTPKKSHNIGIPHYASPNTIQNKMEKQSTDKLPCAFSLQTPS